MTEAAYRTAEELLDENTRLRARVVELEHQVAVKDRELAAHRYAMADFAAELASCLRRLAGVKRVAEVSAMDTSEGTNDG